MPTTDNDPSCNIKKRLIGNDHVTIVYNDSGLPYHLGMISGKFARVAVVVEPQDEHCLLITVQAKDEVCIIHTCVFVRITIFVIDSSMACCETCRRIR